MAVRVRWWCSVPARAHSFVSEWLARSRREGEGDHDRARPADVTLITNAELSRLSHLVSSLERRGLVRRKPDPTDGRYTNAVLTETGLAHLTEAAPGHVARVRELVIEALDEPALQALRAAAESIIARIDRAR